MKIRFSLRAFLISIGALCFLLGLLAMLTKKSVKVESSAKELRDLGVDITFDWEGIAGREFNLVSVRGMVVPGEVLRFRLRIGSKLFWGGTESVQAAQFDNLQITQRIIFLLKECDTIPWVRIHSCGITKGSIQQLSHLKGMKYLEIQQTSVKDLSFLNGASSESLEVLALVNTNIGDNDLRGIAELQNLEELDLSDNDIGNLGMKYIGQCKSLRVLVLNNTSIGEEGLALLENLPCLKEIHLKGVRLSKKALIHFVNNSVVQSIKIEDYDLAHEVEKESKRRDFSFN